MATGAVGGSPWNSTGPVEDWYNLSSIAQPAQADALFDLSADSTPSALGANKLTNYEYLWQNPEQAFGNAFAGFYGHTPNIANPFYNQIMNQVVPGLKWTSYLNSLAGGASDAYQNFVPDIEGWLGNGTNPVSQGGLQQALQSLFSSNSLVDPNNVLTAFQTSRDPNTMSGIIQQMIAAMGYGNIAPETLDTVAYMIQQNLSNFLNSGMFEPNPDMIGAGGNIWTQHLEDMLSPMLGWLGT